MIHECDGDILASIYATLVCPVNTVGVMGAGLAKAFARRFPDLAVRHREQCADGTLDIGKPTIVFYPHLAQAVVLLATKRDWRDPSQLAYVEDGLKTLVERVQSHRWQIDALAVPALGCGLGGLDWAVVEPVMMHYLGQLGMPVEVYPPKQKRKGM